MKSGPVEEVTRRGGLVRVRLAEPVALASVADALEGRAPAVEGDVLVYALGEGEDPAEVQSALLPILIERGCRVLEVRLGDSLEAAYLASRRSHGVDAPGA